MHDAYISGRFRRTKITRKANDVAENLQFYRVVRFFHPRSSCKTHLMLFSERPLISHYINLYLRAIKEVCFVSVLLLVQLQWQLLL